MITVTDSAKKQAIRLMDDDDKKGFFIRVGVEGGGCSGLMYQLTFDNAKKEGDSSFESFWYFFCFNISDNAKLVILVV